MWCPQMPPHPTGNSDKRSKALNSPSNVKSLKALFPLRNCDYSYTHTAQIRSDQIRLDHQITKLLSNPRYRDFNGSIKPTDPSKPCLNLLIILSNHTFCIAHDSTEWDLYSKLCSRLHNANN
jgi:hypothetical protein